MTIEELSKELYIEAIKLYKQDPTLLLGDILDEILSQYNDEVVTIINDNIIATISSSVGAIESLKYEPPTKLELSQRLYRNSEQTAIATQKVVAEAINNQETIKKIRERLYDGYGYEELLPIKKTLPKYLKKTLAREKIERLKTKHLKTAYAQLLQTTNDKELQKNIKIALEERARYYALRIAKTEEAKAFNFKLIAEHISDGVLYVKWTRAGSFKSPCACEYYANANIGFGRGVYPLKDAPVPILSTHPFCRCTLRAVKITKFTDKENPLDKANDAERKIIERGLKNSPQILVKDML